MKWVVGFTFLFPGFVLLAVWVVHIYKRTDGFKPWWLTNLQWYGWRHFFSVRWRPLLWLHQMACDHLFQGDSDPDQGPGPSSPHERCHYCRRLRLWHNGRWVEMVDWPYGQFFPWEV